MPVQRVEDKKPSGLQHGIKSAVIGGALGYGARYALPLTAQEMDTDYKNIVKLIKDNAEKAQKEFLKSIENLPEKSLAHDAYISASGKSAKIGVQSFNLAVKKIRPAQPFIVAGAIMGLGYSFIKNVFFD